MSDLTNLLKLLIQNNESQKKEVSINEAERLFLNYIEIKNTPQTLKFYKTEFNCINKYFKYFNITSTNQLDNDFAMKLINEKRKEGVKDNTINKMLGTIKAMLNFLFKEKYIDENKITLKKIKTQEAKIIIPSDEEIKIIKDYFDNKATLEYKLMFYLIIDTGLRRSSIANLLISDIDLKEQSIIPSHMKEHNEIKVFFGNSTKELIQEFIKQKKKLKSKYLFPSKNPKKPIEASTITKIFIDIRNKLDISSLSPHRLRHYFGTNLIKNNVNPEIVRKLLGHSSLYMTQRYINLNDSDLKQASLKNSLADNLK